MSFTSSDASDRLVRCAAALAEEAVVDLSDDALIEHQRALAQARRHLDAASAMAAAELARRSARELGHQGLAQRHGARTPEALVQQATGLSRREASALVRVGAALADDAEVSGGAGSDAGAGAALPVWLRPAADALRAGRLSVEVFDIIRTILGAAVDGWQGATPPDDALGALVDQLLAEAADSPPEAVAVRARELRDAAFADGVAQRERQARERRHLHLTSLDDGSLRLTALFDPESAALIRSAFDAVSSPRRGGPRFVAADSRERSSAIEKDRRTTPQLMLDAFVDMVRLAVGADPGTLFGAVRPAVRVLVSERSIARAAGAAPVGHLEDNSVAISLPTVDRLACDGGVIPIIVDDRGEPLRLGRAQRLFSHRQRVALAARDGGCRFPGCQRPPSWTEAHHIVPWSRGGPTDVGNAVLLCRHHHLLVHNNGWAIDRDDAGDLCIRPPADLDPTRAPVPMPSRSAAMRALTAEPA